MDDHLKELSDTFSIFQLTKWYGGTYPSRLRSVESVTMFFAGKILRALLQSYLVTCFAGSEQLKYSRSCNDTICAYYPQTVVKKQRCFQTCSLEGVGHWSLQAEVAMVRLKLSMPQVPFQKPNLSNRIGGCDLYILYLFAFGLGWKFNCQGISSESLNHNIREGRKSCFQTHMSLRPPFKYHCARESIIK